MNGRYDESGCRLTVLIGFLVVAALFLMPRLYLVFGSRGNEPQTWTSKKELEESC